MEAIQTSLHDIVNTQDKNRFDQNLQLLFKPKAYAKFELSQFYKHGLYEKNEHYNFFLDILEEWNRKVDQKLVNNISDTLFHRNIFVFNTLRSSIMQQLQSAQKVLNHLYSWFTNSRNRNVRPVEKKEKDEEGVDEDWIVRNTFKSNLPAQIDLYRRRVCCRLLAEKDRNRLQQLHQGLQKRKIKTQSWVHQDIKQEEAKRIAKHQNDLVRFQRQAKELVQVQKKWKVRKARDQEGGIKNFYRANFSSCKTYFPKRQKQNEEKKGSSQSLQRAKTSLGMRNMNSSKSKRLSQGDEQITSQKDTFVKPTTFFDEFEEVRLGDINGMRLLNNPQEVKLKKKKRAK